MNIERVLERDNREKESDRNNVQYDDGRWIIIFENLDRYIDRQIDELERERESQKR